MSTSDQGIGGFKEAIFMIKGKGAYSRLKYESGVHRVQGSQIQNLVVESMHLQLQWQYYLKRKI